MLMLSFYYLRWHYSDGIFDLVGVIRNFLWFFYEFFSIPLLLKTLFVPFNRIKEEHQKGFNPALWAQELLVNTLMRVVGALLRVLTILIGIIIELLTLISGFAFVIIWLCVPLLVIFLIGFGIIYIILG